MAARLGSQGAAPSTLQTKEYVPRLFDAFRSSNDELKNLYKQPWERLPEKVCAGRDVYERFAFFLPDRRPRQRWGRRRWVARGTGRGTELVSEFLQQLQLTDQHQVQPTSSQTSPAPPPF